MKAWQRLNYRAALDLIIDIEDAGHRVERFTDYHWRIDGIDVWPTTKKYLRAGDKVAAYENLTDLFPL